MAGADCRSPCLNPPPRLRFRDLRTSPLSALLAGLLAHDHGKQVLRIADPVCAASAAGPRLGLAHWPPGPPAGTLLAHAEAETRELLAALDAKETLAPTSANWSPITRPPPPRLPTWPMSRSASACAPATASSPGISRLNGEISLADSKVVTVERDAAKLNFTRTGAAELSISGEPAAVGQIVLADDAAILDSCPRHSDRRNSSSSR